MNWSTLIGIFIGGAFTLAGGWFQVYLSHKKSREDMRTALKISLLEDFMGNRLAMKNNLSVDISGYKVTFFSAFNRIDVTFSDSSNVIKKLREYENALFSKEIISSDRFDEVLYELVKSMYIDLNLEAPTQEQFFSSTC